MKILFSLLPLVVLTLSACGGAGDPINSNIPEATSSSVQSMSASSAAVVKEVIAPSVQVLFPTQTSIIDADTVLLRGTITDKLGSVTRVSVNDVTATSEDNYGHWQVRVPLSPGANKLSVSAADKADKILAESVITVERANIDEQPIYDLPHRNNLLLDSANNRLLLLDAGDLVALDLSSGLRKIVAKSLVAYVSQPSHAMTLDTEHNRVLLVEDHNILAVDLATGAITLFYNGNTLSLVSWINNPSAIALDTKHNRALVTIYKPAITAVDLTSGVGSMLIQSAVNCFGDATDIVVDADRNRALISEGGSISEMDLETASCKKVRQEVKPVSLDAVNDRIIEANSEGIFAVDIASGTRSLLSAGAAMIDVHNFSLDVTHNRAFFLNRYSSSLYVVDLLTGERAVFSKF